MSKRFTDTDLWNKPWFMDLAPEEKAAWFYIKDVCDSVGVWTINRKLAAVHIGVDIDWSVFITKCNGNIVEMKPGKLWLVDFCDFQYGELREECRPHQSYLRLLEKHGIKGYIKGIDTLKEKEKEKEKEKDKKRALHPIFDVPMNQTRYDNLCVDYGKAIVDDAIESRIDWERLKGKPEAKDYAAAAASWLKMGKVPKKPKETEVDDWLKEAIK